MIGFSLKRGNDVVYAAVQAGSIGVIISNKEGTLKVSLSGIDAHGVYYVWYDDKICIGDSILIKYENINEQMLSTPIFIRDVKDKESENKLLLDSYYKLKKELLAEGLLSQ